jgi:multicomponent Na+:H+ antiporter subunit F
MNLDFFISYIVLPVLSISIALIFYRFYKGPTVADRVVALDLLITIGIGIITAYSIYTDQSTFLDAAMLLALIAFLGTIAFSFYLEKKDKNE